MDHILENGGALAMRTGSETSEHSHSDASSVSSNSEYPMTAWKEPVAIIGYSFRLPQDCTTNDGFWKTLWEKRHTATQWPEDRLNIKSFYHPDNSRVDCVSALEVSDQSSQSDY